MRQRKSATRDAPAARRAGRKISEVRLRRWLRLIAAIREEAAEHRLAEVELLAGMTALAIRDLIDHKK